MYVVAGPVCEEELLPAGVADTQLPADTAVQAAVAQGGGRQPQIHHVIMSSSNIMSYLLHLSPTNNSPV